MNIPNIYSDKPDTSKMAAEYVCDLCDKSYLRKGNLARHKAKHSEVERDAQVADVVADLVQVAADQVADAPLFADIELPGEFPDFDEDYLALIDVEVDIDDPQCGKCDESDAEVKTLKTVKERLLRKVIALEKAQKTLRKFHKDQKIVIEHTRELLEKATKENATLKMKAKTNASKKVIDVEEEAEPVIDCSKAKLWQCVECDYNTANKFAMQAHVGLKVHSGRPSPVQKKVEPVQTLEEQIVLLRTIQCEKCEVKCFDENELKYHSDNMHSGPRPCRNGDSCRFMASGRCKFAHREVVEEGWEEVIRRGRRTPTTSQQGVQPCKYDDFCTKGRFCAFTHSKWRSAMPVQSRFQFYYTEEDFPSLQSIRRNH